MIKKIQEEIVINFHLTKNCNMNCIFCFGEFHGCGSELELKDWIKIVDNIYDSLGGKHVRITLAGGEPFLFKEIETLIKYIHNKGFKVGVITNGSLITEKFILKNAKYLDNIGISIDSFDVNVNYKLNRYVNKPIKKEEYLKKCSLIKNNGIKLKINTLINKLNFNQNMIDFIKTVKPDRWKVLKIVLLEEQNLKAEYLDLTEKEFNIFVNKHISLNPIVEGGDSMVGSYIIVAPSGKLVDNTKNKYSYSKNLIENNFLEELSSTGFSIDKFKDRYI